MVLDGVLCSPRKVLCNSIPPVSIVPGIWWSMQPVYAASFHRDISMHYNTSCLGALVSQWTVSVAPRRARSNVQGVQMSHLETCCFYIHARDPVWRGVMQDIAAAVITAL
ncbi:hypothetical protein HaLaN_08815 [Haematococcus lacustris]|uniref:Uncharacterized protein n=1 Tax=Haematococcus lacustris TaxID=44745 RepID=A0A699Z172_HAELA|nr:hypothetical protein HaLaN_08815 [Haematococcus lacustris]